MAEMDIQHMLKERLAIGATELAVIHASLEKHEAAVSQALKEIPKGFRGSRVEYDGMDTKLSKLEYAHSTRTNLSNAQEREMLKEMANHRKRKKELAAFLVLDDTLKAAKQLRDDERKKLEAAESVQNELSAALRKLEMADRLGCKALDLIEKVVPVPEEARGRLVGRGGVNIRAVESDCDVAIDLDRKGGFAKVHGLTDGVTKAVLRLEEVTKSVVVDLTLDQPYLVMLLARRASLSNKFQEDFGVKVDVFGRAQEASSRVSVTGRPDAVDAACAAIKNLKAISKHLSLPAAARPAVIGTKGAGVMALEKKFDVIIDSSKDEASDKVSRVSVTGSSQNVSAAMSELNAQISAQEPVVLDVPIASAFISQVLLADRGSRLRSLQSQSGVSLTLDKDKAVLSVAGARGVAVKGKEVVESFIASVTAKSLVIPLGSSSVGSVVGKGGTMIRDIRTPGVVVEVDEEKVRVFADDAALAMVTADKVRALVDRNQRISIPLTSTLSRQLFGMPGRVTRKAILDLDDAKELSMERERGTGAAILKGQSDHLSAATRLIESFMASHVEVSIELLCSEDERALVGGGEDCALRLIQQMCHVDLTLGKVNGSSCITVAGQETNVGEAERRIRGELDGSPDGKVVVVMVDEEAMGAAIGKKGANAKRIESLYKVKLDSVLSRSLIRIKGSDASNVENARVDLVEVLSQVLTSASIVLPASKALHGANIDGIAAECGLEWLERSELNKKVSITIRGKDMATRSAKQRLIDLSNGLARKALELDETQSRVLKSRTCPLHKEFRKISNMCTKAHGQLSIDVTSIGEGALIAVEGTLKSTALAYKLLVEALSHQFPGMFLSVPLPHWPGEEAGVLLIKELIALVGKEALQKVADNAKVDGAAPLISLDAANHCVVVNAADPACASSGKALLLQHWNIWFERHACVSAPEWAWGMVIGAKGAGIKALKAAHGADKGLKDINVDKENGRIVLEGEPKFVGSAAAELRKKIASIKPITGKDSKESLVEIPVPHQMVPYVIGKKGTEIRRIEAASKATLNMGAPSGGKSERFVSIKGSKSACDAAVVLVQEILNRHDPDFKVSANTDGGLDAVEAPVNKGCGWSNTRQAEVLGVVKTPMPHNEPPAATTAFTETDLKQEPPRLVAAVEDVAPQKEEEKLVLVEDDDGEPLRGKGWDEFVESDVVEVIPPPVNTNQAEEQKKPEKAAVVPEPNPPHKLSKNQKRRKNKKDDTRPPDIVFGTQLEDKPSHASIPVVPTIKDVEVKPPPQKQVELKPSPKSNERIAESALADHFGAGSERLMSLLFTGTGAALMSPPGLPVPPALMTSTGDESKPDSVPRYVPPPKRDHAKKR